MNGNLTLGLRAAACTAALWSAFPVMAPATSHSQSTDLSDVSRLSLLGGWQRNDGTYVAAVRIELADGWKTYWRAPGANGIAPIFDWSASQNVAGVGFVWPRPTVYEINGVKTIGYADELILPMVISARDASQPVRLGLDLDYGVCADICVPARGQATTTLTPGMRDNQAPITDAIATRPTAAVDAGISGTSCSLSPNGRDFVLAASVTFDAAPMEPEAVVVEYGSDLIWISDTDHSLNRQVMAIEADMQYYGDAPLAFSRQDVRITLIGDRSSIDIQGCSGG